MKSKFSKAFLLMFVFLMAFSTSIFAATMPTGLTATAGNAQVILDWGDTSDGKYNVYRSIDNSSFTKITSSEISASVYTATGLTNGTLYYFKVTSYDGSAESSQTASVSATPVVASSGGGVSFSGVSLPFTVGDAIGTAVNFLTMYGEWVLLALGVIFAPVLYGLAMKLVAAVKARSSAK